MRRRRALLALPALPLAIWQRQARAGAQIE